MDVHYGKEVSQAPIGVMLDCDESLFCVGDFRGFVPQVIPAAVPLEVLHSS